MERNPFAPHSPAPPAVFVDREREVDLIFGHIRAVQRGNVAVNGPLGIGKTSLLHYIADPAVAASYGLAPSQFALVVLDVHSVTPFSGDRFWRRLGRLLSRMPGARLEEPIARLLSRQSIDITDVEDFLDAVAAGGQVLVLLLDEFEWALQGGSAESQAESRNFLAELASLARRAPRVMSLVVTTEAPLSEATRLIDAWRGSPFATVFTAVTLRPMSRTDADLLLDRALADGAVTFPEEDRQLLYSFSGGQPAALQAAAFALYHGRGQGLEAEALRELARQAAQGAFAATDAPGAAGTSAPRSPLASPPSRDTGLVVDPASGEVLLDGRRIESLTALEYSLLRLLYDSPGRLCSKSEIIRHVWGEEVVAEVDDSRVEKLISRLRRKIEPTPNRPHHLRTVRGRGYRLVP